MQSQNAKSTPIQSPNAKSTPMRPNLFFPGPGLPALNALLARLSEIQRVLSRRRQAIARPA